ncbi:rhodanese-like domain-containing protein [Arenibacter sp. GZD96]|uniref:rhodanese-like domain-containing protein n=1 Tax=Aurantibrevibacter litoralis TaxID=3106030 RepID=UPI002AFFB0F2|nr:rhodanese-like domain-containing protein [Arenibacter sp. GZD-96]MEA1785923.1 rhodanese-like domain-containing protein [Arenibacter sp. GZD-96]
MKVVLACSFFLFLCLQIGHAQINTKPIKEISQKELNNAIVIDVRTPEEYQQGHLPNAININWYDADFAEQFSAIDKNETIYIYCKVGGRSAKATEKLDALGFSKVINLDGGYDGWSKKQEQH